MHVFLETERLRLRRFTAGDLEDLVALNSDPEVMRYLTGGSAIPREEIEREYLPAYLAYHAHPEDGDRYGFWVAEEKATGAFLGWFHFRPHGDAPRDEPELGYRLRRAAWGKGYGTEGARALIAKGFAELGVGRVVAGAYAENVGSWRVMEKAGMTLVRRFRLTPEELAGLEEITDPAMFDGDDVEYAITREEWERGQDRTGRIMGTDRPDPAISPG